ncbi:MAG: hypothetical protein KAI64_06595, partial [Thermoplasmata archaeon]|nr:hypothetical protein [Thermoplasmata archaeon]
KIAYIVGILILIGVFFGDYQDPTDSLIMGIFIFPFLAAFIMGEVTVRGKENLFIFRKAPSGESRLIRARLLQGCLVVVPIAVVYAIISLILTPGITPFFFLTFIGMMVLIVAGYVAFALGLFLFKPVFTDKPAELMVHVMILMMTSVFLFIFSFELMGTILGGISMFTLIIWILGITFLYLGKKNLSRIE